MVRVVGSHHFASVVNSLPMYPRLKKHHSEGQCDPRGCGHQGRSWHQPEDSTPGTNHPSNIPNLNVLNQTIIDDNLARKATEALRYPRSEWTDTWDGRTSPGQELRQQPREHPIDEHNRDHEHLQIHHSPETDSFISVENHDNDVEMCDSEIRQRQTCCEQSVMSEDCSHRRRHDSSMTEDDGSVTGEASGEVNTERKTRRRQRNKLSAQAYRQRKRSKADEQNQVLANLEAENSYLLNSLKKLEDEKREFLEYLRTDMNIDLTKDNNGDLYMTNSES